MHKGQLASDRTSCRSPLANQMRLILHTAAYWLMLTLRDAIPKAHALAKAEFATIRLRLIKLGARVIETASITHSPRLRCRLPRGRSHQASRHYHQSRRTVKAGAVAAPSNHPGNPQRVAKVRSTTR